MNKKLRFLTGEGGNPTGEVANNIYLTDFVYDSQNGNKFGSTVYQKISEEESVLVYDNQLFEGEDGYTYYNALNYDNTIKGFPLLNYSGQKIAFAYAYLNPFHYLLADDFMEVEGKENTYTLTKAKGTFFASCVLGDIDVAFSDIISNIEFVIENYELKTIKVVPPVDEDITIDYNTMVTKYYSIEQVATFDVKEVGTATIQVPSVKETKEEHAALQSALDKFKANNYTATLEVELNVNSTISTGVYTYYYDGSSIYISTVEDQSAPSASDILLYQYEGDEFLTPLMYDETSSKFTSDAAESLEALENVFTYKDLCPVVNEVRAEIFNYQSFRKTYEVCKEMLPTIGKMAFVPPINPINDYLGDIIKFLVRTTNDGNIDYVSFTFESSGWSTVEGKCTLSYDNIGTTVLPHNLVVE